eukprot:TRINITY_DN3853_c0_g1_i3.p1 TRINITY_DN3853_c0_g1~~TRINITY_DN3853_c0_g1_i3.p1  ORF type:complete len:542 (-),score=73.06 TRINITY_DN3853_c0_g1_i3:85-1710(-)
MSEIQLITPESTKEQVVEWLNKYDGGVFDIKALYICNGKMLFGFSENQLTKFYQNEVLGAALFNTLHSVQPRVQDSRKRTSDYLELENKLLDIELKVNHLSKRSKTEGSTNNHEFGDSVLRNCNVVLFEDFGLVRYTGEWPLWKSDKIIPGKNTQCLEIEIQTRLSSYFSALELDHLLFVDGHLNATLGKKKPDLVWYHSNSEEVPSNIVIVGEIKTSEELKKSDSRGQLTTYLHRIISSSPHRNMCFGFLTDGHEIAFTKVVFKEDSDESNPYTYWLTDFKPIITEETLESGGLNLLSLLHSHPSELGWSIPKITHNNQSFSISRNLGQGKTSFVWASGQYAIKQMKKRYINLMGNELEVLDILGTKKIAGVPRISCIGDDIFCEPFKNFTAHSLLEFLMVLKAVHDLGFVHRDIRPSNLIQFSGQVYLIDWGYAARKGTRSNVVGNLFYVSNEILASSDFPNVVVHPSHDLHMLIKMLYLRYYEDITLEGKNREKILLMWNEKFPEDSFWARALGYGSNLDYNGVYKEIFNNCQNIFSK